MQTSIQANLCQSLNGLLMNRRRTCAGKMSRKALKVNATEMVESQKGTLQGEALLTRNTALVRRIALHLFRPRNYVADCRFRRIVSVLSGVSVTTLDMAANLLSS